MFALYLHIPYCASKCYYCDFYSAAVRGGVPDAYIDALVREMRRFAPRRGGRLRPDTVYFGGGTPSLLRPDQAARLLEEAAPAEGAEITLEANPDTVTPESLRAYRRAGVNRLSLGVQSAFDESLRRLGRRHTADAARRALAAAREAGFDNVSGDVMLALPRYTRAELDATLSLLLEGGCTHVSCYLLTIEPDTVFGRRPPEGLPGDDEAAGFYLAAVRALSQAGFAQYEISNFARPGFESRHNLAYWHCEEYLGLGPAAASCMGARRFSTPRGTAAFLAGEAQYADEGPVTAEDEVMLRLRLAEGLDLDALQAKWGVRWDARRLAFCRTLARRGLARFDGRRLALTPRGFLVQNSILCELM